MADLNADLDGQLASLGFLLDAAAASPQAFDLETVLGRARRAVAAIRDNPGLADRKAWTALGDIAGVSAKTVKRAMDRSKP